MKRKKLILLFTFPALLLIGTLGYTGWNMANPENTCASCHEIAPSHATWQASAHRDVRCIDCHGTALSNGLHSLREKSAMLANHLLQEEDQRVPKLDESGVLEVMNACINCHREEYHSWNSGGHSATYADIFLNEAHNHMEQPYPDCFRCHGMYYDRGISDLMHPISTEGPWHLKDADQYAKPVIPCLTCHGIHLENTTRMHPTSMDDPGATFYQRIPRDEYTSLYIRADKIHLRSNLLRKPDIFHQGEKVMVADDPVQRICMQCHASDWAHEAGSQDDRTPVGVHEGISCLACHDTHSNDPSNSCLTCHPAISNCKQDVKKMNTSYRNRNSPHNIHSMMCTDCHNPIPAI